MKLLVPKKCFITLWSFSDPYFPAFALNTDQKNSEYRQFLHSDINSLNQNDNFLGEKVTFEPNKNLPKEGYKNVKVSYGVLTQVTHFLKEDIEKAVSFSYA